MKNNKMHYNQGKILIASMVALVAASGIGIGNLYAQDNQVQLSEWPNIKSPFVIDAAQEEQIKNIVSSMTLRQKIGQMVQPEIKKITPNEVRQYYIGSVLNGGGSWPAMNKYAKLDDWVKLSDAYYKASMTTDMKTQIPVIWGIDAVHGNNNIYGATMYPHNIGLGAARNPNLVKEIAYETAKAVRSTGINWAFAPTVAVGQNPRWGRTYESYSSNPELVKIYADAFIKGMQGDLKQPENVVASVKHFIGDGGTKDGVDQGQNFSSEKELINLHGLGYFSAIGAGSQTVMITYNSWDNDEADNKDRDSQKGKIHGNHYLVTDVLKGKMGFNGFVISDYNAIGQVKGCTNAHCTQSVNAGIDMFMVPDDWKEFIENTVKDVEEGRISQSRIDDAVTRIIRVKMRSGLFEHNPAQNKYAGDYNALSNKALARSAVSQSLVLLKNNNKALPLAKSKKILLVGNSADSFSNQTGGWSLTWQGDENKNSDFTNGQTLLGALKAELGENLTYSPDGKGINPKDFDAIIAVVGETPYAEMKGDIVFPAPLTSDDRLKGDKEAMKNVAGKGVPVITILYSGRPLYTNDIMNMSDAFVAAWLPGTEAAGILDVILKNGDNIKDFRGRLSFPWPSSPCPPSLNVAQNGYKPLFKYGYGLGYGDNNKIGKLPVENIKTCKADK